MVHIVAICGSLRTNSHNLGLLKAMVNRLPALGVGSTIDIVVPSELPLFNEDIEGQNLPQSVNEFQDKLSKADGFLFALCEYNGSLSAAAKNAIDWGTRGKSGNKFNNKPAGVVSAGGGFGGYRAQSHFRDIAFSVNMKVMNYPVINAKLFEKQLFNAKTGEVIDEKLKDETSKYIEDFIKWTIIN
eukprot:gene11529-15444_t